MPVSNSLDDDVRFFRSLVSGSIRLTYDILERQGVWTRIKYLVTGRLPRFTAREWLYEAKEVDRAAR